MADMSTALNGGYGQYFKDMIPDGVSNAYNKMSSPEGLEALSRGNMLTQLIGAGIQGGQAIANYDYPKDALGWAALPAQAVTGMAKGAVNQIGGAMEEAPGAAMGWNDGSQNTNLALGMLGIGGLGYAPAGALRAGIGRTSLNRSADLPAGSQDLLKGRTDEEVARMLDVAGVHDKLAGLEPKMSGPKSGENWFPGANVRLDTPVSEIESGMLRSDRGNYDAPKTSISWEDQLGKTVIPFIGDRTAVGNVSRFGGVDIDPVSLYGGKDYMRGAEEGVWASEAKALKPVGEAAAEVSKPLGVYAPMAGTGSDFAHMTNDMLSRVWSPSQLSKSGIAAVNNKIRTGAGVDGAFPDAPSINTPEFQRLIESDSPLRKAYIQALDNKDIKGLGGPDMGAIRYAITDSDLRNVPSPTKDVFNEQLMGWGAADIDPSGLMRAGNHPTYNTDLAGNYLGELPLAPRSVVMRDWTRMRRQENPTGWAQDPRSIFTGPTRAPQIIDQEMVDALMGYQMMVDRARGN
tara:strand:+ start:90 stop:1640 length:1551 start_codon:yes stop_codon:yes gene_type:complete